jgi:hypothetical protein
MKVSLLVVLIVLPMLATIGFYTYAFVSTRWSYIDETFIDQHTTISKQREHSQSPNQVQLQSRSTRHAFRSRYGLFGYCLDYKWLDLLTIKPSVTLDEIDNEQSLKANTTSLCAQCPPSAPICAQTGCCVSRK